MTQWQDEPVESCTAGVVCSIGVGPEHGGRPRNEDNYLIGRSGRVVWREGEAENTRHVPGADGCLFAVADGMGGHDAGDLAATSALEAVASFYGTPPGEDPEETMRIFVLDSHRRLRARLARGAEVKLGTTLTVAWLLGNRVFWVNVGDSRLYHWRAGKLTRISRDQTRAEFARRDRRPMPSNPTFLAQSFIFGSRGLGADGAIRIDRGIDAGSFTVQPEDRLLICTDGLTAWVEDRRLADVLQNVADPQHCAVSLIERAIAARSDDNITALVVRMISTPERHFRRFEEEDSDTILPT